MKKEIFYAADGYRMNFEVYTPDSFEQNLPMIVFLHGAGERGRNIEHLARHAIPRMLENGAQLPAVVLCPQCPADCVWDNVPFDVKEIIDFAAARYFADPSRISLTGCSMGGFGTWAVGMAFPAFFCALAPVAGGGLSWRTPNLVKTPVHAWHGDSDTAVPPVYAELIVNSLLAAGGDAQLTLLPGRGHNDGINEAYESWGIVQWLLAQRRTDFTPVAEFLSEMF